MTLDKLTNEELRELLARFAKNFNEIRQVLRSIGDAADTLADAIDENLAALHQLDAQD